MANARSNLIINFDENIIKVSMNDEDGSLFRWINSGENYIIKTKDGKNYIFNVVLKENYKLKNVASPNNDKIPFNDNSFEITASYGGIIEEEITLTSELKQGGGCDYA